MGLYSISKYLREVQENREKHTGDNFKLDASIMSLFLVAAQIRLEQV